MWVGIKARKPGLDVALGAQGQPLQDVLDEKITPSYAERVYGVAIDIQLGKIDEAARTR